MNTEQNNITKPLGYFSSFFRIFFAKTLTPTRVTSFSRKIFLCTLIFIFFFAIRLSEYLDVIRLTHHLNYFYATLNALMIVAIVPTTFTLFVKSPLRQAGKFMLVIVSLSLSGFGAYSSLLKNNHTSFFTSTFILFILGIIILFEQRYIIKSNCLLNKINTLIPKDCLKKQGPKFIPYPTANLKIKDLVKIKALESIPCDGVIVSGTTSVDESPITGEFKPLLKSQNDFVVGGSINRDSDIVIEVTKEKQDTVIEKLINYTNDTLSKKSISYKRSRLFQAFFAIMGLAIGTGFWWQYYLIMHLPLYISLYIAISITLSFALISLPGSVLIATNIYRKQILANGIILKDIKSIHKTNKLDTLFFDKTGTLTKGNFAYAQHFVEYGTNQGKLLSAFFSLAKNAQHPLALAMESHPWYHEIHKHPVQNFKEQTGLGACGYIEPRSDKRYFAAMGNLRYLKRMQMQISREMKAKIDDLESLGETVLLCGYDRFVRGVLTFVDGLRPQIKETLCDIIDLKIEPAIITSDSEASLSNLINECAITKIYSRCTPAEKEAKIEKEIQEGHTVGFVGADIDHLPFEKAHVTFTIDQGTLITNNQADIILMGSSTQTISWFIKATKNLCNKIRSRHTVPVTISLLLAAASTQGFTTPEFVLSLMCLVNLVTLRAAAKE